MSQNVKAENQSEELRLAQYAVQVGHLYDAGMSGINATMVNAFIVVFILWQQYSRVFLFSWLVMNLLVVAVRLLNISMYKSTVERSDYDAVKWGNYFTFGLSVTGILWGLLAWLTLPGLSIEYTTFIVLLCGGMVAGSVGTYSAVKKVILCYAPLLMVPLIIRFFQRGANIYYGIGLLICVFTILMISSAVKINRTICRSIRLQFENVRMVEDIKAEQKRIQDLNRKLQLEIMEHGRTLKSLRASESKYRLLAENVSDVIWVLDNDLKYSYIGLKIKKLQGYQPEELIGRPFYVNFPESDHEKIQNRITQIIESRLNIPSTMEIMLQHKKGHKFHVEINMAVNMDDEGNVTGIVGVTRDISLRKKSEIEKKKLDEQLKQIQKIESLGVLTGGIAHDFNNLLVGVLGNADLLLYKKDLPERAEILISKIRDAAVRGAELVNQMLAYSGKGEISVEPLDLNERISSMISLIKAILPEKITLKCNCADELPEIEADPSLISQAIMNLVLNSSEAIGDRPGVITIKTGLLFLKQVQIQKILINEHLSPGYFAYIEVIDDGCGMDENTQSRIFEPFFTTKFTGRGLGLSSLLGILHGHNGTYQVQSKPGEGTRFKIMFPIIEDGS